VSIHSKFTCTTHDTNHSYFIIHI